MRPAFSSTKQAMAFALLLLVLLLAPALAGKRILPPREAIYSSIWWENGDFPYMDGQIFSKTGPMDIVFMGSSHIWAAFNTPNIQAQLSKQLGRPAIVRTFGWGGPGYDELYFTAQDLLAYHRVRMLVFDDDCSDSGLPHLLAPRMYRYADNANSLNGLPASFQAMYYFGSIMGLPRNLLAMVHSNLPADLNAPNYWVTRSHAENFSNNLGTFVARSGFRSGPNAQPEPFVQYTPQTDASPSDVCVYSDNTKANFAFSAEPLPLSQIHFLRELTALARQSGCKLVVIHVPIFDERRSPQIAMPAFQPDVLPADVAIVGIPPATFFKGLADDDIRKLYSDSVHLNQNGQNYFTRLMMPALLKLYDGTRASSH